LGKGCRSRKCIQVITLPVNETYLANIAVFVRLGTDYRAMGWTDAQIPEDAIFGGETFINPWRDDHRTP
jgi:hypothetical protein